MTDETTKTPAQPEVKKGEKYSYAALTLNANFTELVQNLYFPMKSNPFAATACIPALQYFEEMSTGKSENAQKFQTFLKNCEESLDVITNFPKPAAMVGCGEMYNVQFNEIPETVKHMRNLYSALTYFRKLAGYIPDVKDKTVKDLSMNALAEVREKGTASNR